MIRSILLLLFLFLFPSCSAISAAPADIEEYSPRHYICCKTAEPLKMDGKLDEPAWKEAEWTADFADIEGPDKPRPRLRTRAKMLFDDQYFYMAAELEEPDIWANLTERDSIIFYDNDFEVFIDPDGDTFYYYEMEMNAFNTVWDLFLDKPYRDGCKPLFYWDIRGMKTGVSIDGTINRPGDKDTGWTVEIAMPWAVLKECADGGNPPVPGDQWRINFSRVEWRVEVKDGKYVKVINPETGKPFPENNWVWSPQGVINMHCPEKWGFVQFSSKAPGTAVEPFVPKPEDAAKWALRRVYYRQKSHFEEHGAFTDSLSALGLKDLKVKGYRWPPAIKHTWNLFEAVLESTDGKEKWHIAQDGRVWKSQ
jgi:hypothetical protein